MEDKKELSYEEQLEKLKEVVVRLRSDEIPLSEALALADYGRKQYEECKKMLDGIEEELEVFVKA